jgi:lysine biosynthesis protein LysW
MSALCVECDAELDLIGRARVGQRVTCPNCGVRLEVVGLHPIEVDLYIADDDEDDDWEDELDGFSLEDDMNLEELDAAALLDADLSAEDDYEEIDLDESEFDEEDDLEDDAFALR